MLPCWPVQCAGCAVIVSRFSGTLAVSGESVIYLISLYEARMVYNPVGLPHFLGRLSNRML